MSLCRRSEGRCLGGCAPRTNRPESRTEWCPRGSDGIAATPLCDAAQRPGVYERSSSPAFPKARRCRPPRLLAPDHYSAATWPLVLPKQRLPRKVFRRSIAWLSDSLSTLRRTGYPATTQDSLPAAGQALPDGLLTRKVPTKGFRSASYISSPFPKLRLAQGSRPLDRSSQSETTQTPP